MATRKRKAAARTTKRAAPKKKRRAAVKKAKATARKAFKASRPAWKKKSRPIRKPFVRKKGKKASKETVKVLENSHVRSLLTELAGEKALVIAGELYEPISDEDLADASKFKISEVRAVMNKLHSAGVASYARTRNDEGWYTYTWSLCLDKAKKLVSERKAEKRALKGQKRDAEQDCYVCPGCHKRDGRKFSFEKAVETEFRCPECSEMLKYAEKK